MENRVNIKGLTNKTLDNLLEGFQLIDFEWRHCYINHAMLRQSSYTSKKDLIGYTMMEKYPGIEDTEVFKKLKSSMNDRISLHFETKFELPDKSEKWFELRVEPVPQGIFILSIDITARKKEELYKLRYVGELEEMIFITSHKVRRPIANLFGLSKMLQKNSNSPDKFKTIAGFILDSVKSLDLFTIELTRTIEGLKRKNKTNNGVA